MRIALKQFNLIVGLKCVCAYYTLISIMSLFTVFLHTYVVFHIICNIFAPAEARGEAWSLLERVMGLARSYARVLRRLTPGLTRLTPR